MCKNKFGGLSILSALVAAVASILQLTLSSVVFYNDFLCREYFFNANTTLGNKLACVNTLINESSHCECRERYYGSDTVNNDLVNNEWYVKVFDTESLALAICVFSMLTMMESWRGFRMLSVICNRDNNHYIDEKGFPNTEYFSFFGFFAMVLNPWTFKMHYNYYYGFPVFIDVFGIGLAVRYYIATHVSFLANKYQFLLISISIIFSSCNIIRYVVNIYCINRPIKHVHNNATNKRLLLRSPLDDEEEDTEDDSEE